MNFTIVFQNGKTCTKDTDDIDSVITVLRKRISFMHELKSDDVLEFFDHASRDLLKNPAFRKDYEMQYAARFMKRANLEVMLDTALRNRKALDEFVKLNATTTFYHAQPRGLAVFWSAGNVPLLGLFPLIQALLTKNVCLVKLSSKAYTDLVRAAAFLSSVHTEKIQGSELMRVVTFILLKRDDRETMEKLSMAADIRIAYGGQESINAIMGLKKRFSTVDIAHGPKYSYAVISKEMLNDSKQWAQKLAIDISVFEQYACSSPHTVFVERGGKQSPEAFAQCLAEQLALVCRMIIPKEQENPHKTMEILKIKTLYEFKGKVLSSENNEWAVIYSEEEGFADACGSRVVFVRPLDNLNTLRDMNNRNKQTMGLAMPHEKKMGFADTVTLFGIDRCPALGSMNTYESPWDGTFDIDSMVRWVTCHE